MAQSKFVTATVMASMLFTSPGLFPTAAMATSQGQQTTPLTQTVALDSLGPKIENSCGLMVLNGTTTELRPNPKLKVLNSKWVKLPKFDANTLAVSCSRDSIIPVASDSIALKGHTRPFIISDGLRTGTLSLEKGRYKFTVAGGKLSKIEDSAVKVQLKLMQGESDKLARKKSGGSKVGGCMLGGLLTGLLAAAVSSKRNRGSAAVVGFAAGCALGWTFAANWSKRDKEDLDRASLDALDGPNGNVDWRAPESGEQVRFRTADASERNEDVEFQHLDNVDAPPEGSIVVARPYRTLVRLALRSGPDNDSADNILGRYNAGQMVEVVGLTPDSEWAMIGDGGVVIGYALRSGLADAGQSLRMAKTERYYIESHAQAKPAATRARGARKAKAPAPVMMVQAAPTTPEKIKTVKVAATTQCKSLIAATGQQQQSRTGCNRPGGKWVFA